MLTWSDAKGLSQHFAQQGEDFVRRLMRAEAYPHGVQQAAAEWLAQRAAEKPGNVEPAVADREAK